MQQAAARDVDPAQRAHDGVTHPPRRVGQEGDPQHHPRRGEEEVAGDGAQVAALGDAAPAGHRRVEHVQQVGDGDARQPEPRPQAGRDPGQRPGGDQQQEGGGSRERPPQVVQHLEAADRRDRRAQAAAVGGAGAAEDPRQQLPVAARPAVLASRGGLVVRRELLEQLDVGHQAGTRQEPFEQVVAEQRALRHLAGQGGREGVDVVDALAGERPLPEQVLVDVGDRRRVGIDARRAREDTLEERPLVAGRQRRRDPRLQDAVALDHAAAALVEARPVERVRERADQPAGDLAGQPGVGIQGEHEADGAGLEGGLAVRRMVGAMLAMAAMVARFAMAAVAGREQEGGVAGALQQAVQLLELAALALPAEPASFARAPDAPAV